MKKIPTLLISFAMIMSSFTSYATVQTNNHHQGTALFVQNAEQAIIKKAQKDAATLTLTLSHTHSKVIYFTNRPQRENGYISDKKFSNFWSTYFKDNPPNVAIETAYRTKQGSIKNMTLIGTITQALYQAKTHTMLYTVRLEKNQKITHKKLGRTTVFFDDVPFNPGGF